MNPPANTCRNRSPPVMPITCFRDAPPVVCTNRMDGRQSCETSSSHSRPKNSANSIGGLPRILSSVRSWPSECWQWLWLVPILQDNPTKRWLLDRLLPPLSDCRLEAVVVLVLGPRRVPVFTGGEGCRPISMNERLAFGRGLSGSWPPSGGRPNSRSPSAVCAPHLHVRLRGVPGRACIGTIPDVEWRRSTPY